MKSQPYTGRWIARIGNQIVSQGGTPNQALTAGRASRPKEIPILSYIPYPMTLTYPPILFRLQQVFHAEQGVFVVGGAIRDALLGKTSHDLDLVCLTSTKQLAKKAANALGASFFTMDDARDVHRVIYSTGSDLPFVIDFTGCRGASLEDDLRSRDFTINAIAVDLQDPIKTFDPTGGVQDLHDRVLRVCSPQAFLQDPLRIIRGIRFAAGLQLRIEPNTRNLMKQSAGQLSQSSPERKRDELLKILDLSKASTALRAMAWLDALNQLTPGLGDWKRNHPDVDWDHLLGWIQAIQELRELILKEEPSRNAQNYVSGLVSMKLGRFHPQIRSWLSTPIEQDYSRTAYLILAVVLTKITEGQGHSSQIETIASQMKFSRESSRYLIQFAAALNHLQVDPSSSAQLNPLEIYRFFRGRMEGGLDAILANIAFSMVEPSNLTAHWLEGAVSLLDGWWNHAEEWVAPRPLINGQDLQDECGLGPGPQLGRMLETIRELQITGSIKSRSEAIDWVRQELLR